VQQIFAFPQMRNDKESGEELSQATGNRSLLRTPRDKACRAGK
jgi:hypothetical protein